MKNPPHTYIQKLKGYLDPAVTRKVSSVLFPLACPSVHGEDAPRVRVPSCLCVKVSEKSLGDVTNCREKQRETGEMPRFLQPRKENRCYKERDHLRMEQLDDFNFKK